VLLLALFLLATPVAGASSSTRSLRVGADPNSGFYWPYFLLAPPAALLNREAQRETYILVLPNNTGHPDNDQSVHEASAREDSETSEAAGIAREFGLILLVPAFPRLEASRGGYTHALGRTTLTTDIIELQRPDLQLLAMLSDARKRLEADGWLLNEKILLTGFSASGAFSNRFTAIHPSVVLAVAVGSPGGWPIAPVSSWEGEQLPYPFGISDLADVAGHSFDPDAYSEVHQLLYLGSQDINDMWAGDWQQAIWVCETLGKLPIDRWPLAEEMYHEAGADAIFRVVDGLAHWQTPETTGLVQDFLRSVLTEDGYRGVASRDISASLSIDGIADGSWDNAFFHTADPEADTETPGADITDIYVDFAHDYVRIRLDVADGAPDGLGISFVVSISPRQYPLAQGVSPLSVCTLSPVAATTKCGSDSEATAGLFVRIGEVVELAFPVAWLGSFDILQMRFTSVPMGASLSKRCDYTRAIEVIPN